MHTLESSPLFPVTTKDDHMQTLKQYLSSMALVVTDIWAVCEDPLCASHQHYGINLLSDSERKQM